MQMKLLIKEIIAELQKFIYKLKNFIPIQIHQEKHWSMLLIHITQDQNLMNLKKHQKNI